MNRYRPIVIVAGLLALGACALLANTATQLQKICVAGAPLIQQVVAAPTVNAAALLPYAQSACNVDGTVATTLAPNVTDATPAWLIGVLNGLADAAKIAPAVLPLL